MARPTLWLLVVLSLFAVATTSSEVGTNVAAGVRGNPIAAIQGLVTRLLGSQYVNRFVYEVIPADSTGRDVFEVDWSSAQNKPVVRGNTGVSLASALNYYLKYFCYASVTWGVNGTGDQLSLPSPLPRVSQKIRTVSPVKYRYYMNVCTVRLQYPPLHVCLSIMTAPSATQVFGGTGPDGNARLIGWHLMASIFRSRSQAKSTSGIPSGSNLDSRTQILPLGFQVLLSSPGRYVSRPPSPLPLHKLIEDA